MNIEYVRLCACLREYRDVTPLSITITILALIKVWNDHDQNLSCMVSIHNHTHISQNKTPAGGKTNMFECFHSKLVTFVFTCHDSPWVAMDYLFVFTIIRSLLLLFFLLTIFDGDELNWLPIVRQNVICIVPAMCFAHLYIKNQCLCIRPKVFW
jgi:hypothetical protein